jgi:hypothetical protein
VAPARIFAALRGDLASVGVLERTQDRVLRARVVLDVRAEAGDRLPVAVLGVDLVDTQVVEPVGDDLLGARALLRHGGGGRQEHADCDREHADARDERGATTGGKR